MKIFNSPEEIKHSALLFALIATFLMLLPNISFGLAGISEQSFEYRYSANAFVEFNVPSDYCPPEYGDQSCIILYDIADEQLYDNKYTNLDRLTEINIPQSTGTTEFIIGKSYINGDWLIYDLLKNKEIISSTDQGIVEAKWESLGENKPIFANTDNFNNYFKGETPLSKEVNAEDEQFATGILIYGLIVFLSVFVGIPGVLLGLSYLIYRLTKRKRPR